MNNCGVILVNELFFDQKNFINNDKSCVNKHRDASNHGKKNIPSKKTLSKKTEIWYFDTRYKAKRNDFVQLVVNMCMRNVFDLPNKIQICSFVLNVCSNFM